MACHSSANLNSSPVWAPLSLLAVVLLLLTTNRAEAQGGTSAGPPPGRESFVASFYTGLQIDSFAADELQRYLNPDESAKVVERLIAGFDFQYRLIGRTDDTGRALWVYGETVHGIRSADVNCVDDANLTICQPFTDIVERAPERALLILRKATSLEALVGMRYEFAPMQASGPDEARLYVKAQLGFLTLAGSGKDLIDLHSFAVGAGAVRGRFDGSYLDVGFGRTDLFEVRPNRRFKVDGFLTWSVPWLTERLGLSGKPAARC